MLALVASVMVFEPTPAMAFAYTLRARSPQPRMLDTTPLVDGVVLAGIAILAAEAIADKPSPVMISWPHAQADATPDDLFARQLADAQQPSADLPELYFSAEPLNLRAYAEEAFMGMAPAERRARESAADEVFERAVAVLAAGLVIAAPKDRLQEALEPASEYDDGDSSAEAEGAAEAVDATKGGKRRHRFT